MTALSRNALYGEAILTINPDLDHLNPIQRIDNVLISSIQLYRCIFEAYRKNHDLIRWVQKGTENITLLGPILSRLFNMSIRLTKNLNISLCDHCDFRGLNLAKWNFHGLNLAKWNFHGLILRSANFTGADLSRADLSNTNLYRASFKNAKLCRTNFHAAVLREADLQCYDLSYVDLREANLEGTKLPGNFSSYDTRKQFQHLKSRKIKGLKL